jgi:hypothetical protein
MRRNPSITAENKGAILQDPNGPLKIPVSDFELIYTEGDGNNTRAIRNQYHGTLAMYAYDGAAPRAMALEDVPEPKPAHVFLRGNANNPGVETPARFITCLSSGPPKPFNNGSGRLELAKAIVSRDNPLTARVIVNRVWMHHFGQGLVRTPSDFGLRGDAPTHPELLDHLAVTFMDNGWSLKKLHKAILLSATYRQSSADRPEARKLDPENQLLWRMNRRRLDFEALRDGILSVSGTLDRTYGGVPFSLTALPSVPRRTVYAYVERGKIPGMLSLFDFPSPDQHAPMRYTTTVPQQALFLLNSPFLAEQAKYLIARAKTGDENSTIHRLYEAIFGREPTAQERAAGLAFVAQQPLKPRSPSPNQTHGNTESSTVTRSWPSATLLATHGKARPCSRVRPPAARGSAPTAATLEPRALSAAGLAPSTAASPLKARSATTSARRASATVSEPASSPVATANLPHGR